MPGRIGVGALVALGVGLSALVIFAGLGQRYLWEDEAETALLAQRVLRFGVPLAWDGASLISQECGQDYDANYAWRQTPWLPIYLTAASFKLFDAGTVAARLPFALLGLLAVPSMYLLARRVFADRMTGLIAAGSLLLSVPFLLHVRQCRYYSLALFASIWILYFFFTLPVRRRLAAAGLALALTVLVHASHLLFMGAVVGLVLGLLVVRFDRAVLPWFAASLAAALVVNVPWLIGTDLGGKSGSLFALASGEYPKRLIWYATRIEAYAFPAVLLVAVLIVLAVVTRARIDFAAPATRACLFLVVFTVGHVLVVALVPFVFFRYALTLLPVAALLQAWIVRVLAERSRVLAAAVLLLALLVDRGDLIFRQRLSITLLKYADEIIHHVPGPIEGIVTHLRASARPGDRVFISYGDLPLRFYTKLDIRGGQGCQSLAGWPPPDWVIVRYFFRFRPAAAPGVEDDYGRTIQYLRSEVTPSRYHRIDLPVVDTIWENIPEPDRLVYRPPSDRARVTLYQRIRP